MEAILYLFIFILINLSVVDLWTCSYILSSIRNKVSRLPYSKLLICPECAAFWLGFGLSFIFNPLIVLPGIGHYCLSNIFCGTIAFVTTRFVYSKGIL
jgi:hypothetical protein